MQKIREDNGEGNLGEEEAKRRGGYRDWGVGGGGWDEDTSERINSAFISESDLFCEP